MRELVLTMSKKIFCNINHIIPPDVNDGEENWYNTCKQVTFISIASLSSQPLRLTFFFRLRQLPCRVTRQAPSLFRWQPYT